MKSKQHLTAALLTAFAMPALAARDIKPGDQAPVQPPVEAADNEAPEVGQAQGRIVVQGDGAGRTVVRINGEEIELDGQGGVFELAIPDMIREVAPAPKQIEATFLGVSTDPITAQAAKQLGLEKATGLLLSFIKDDSPAAQAGLKKNDVLLKLNDQILINAEQFVVLIRSFEPGEKVTMHGLRGGEPFNAEVTLGQAMVAPVGPGGATLHQPGWRVQQNGRLGPNGGAMILPDNVFDQLPPFEGAPADLQELIRNMQHNQDQNMQRLLQRLELNLEDIQGGANGGGVMQSQVMKNDGQHSITLKTDNDGRHLTIKNKADEVLYDGLLPENDVEQHLIEDNGLPMDVFKKVQPMLNGNMVKPQPNFNGGKLELELDLDELQQPEQAPEEQAEPGRA